MPNAALHAWGSSLRRRYRAPLSEHMSLGWSQVMHFCRGREGVGGVMTVKHPSSLPCKTKRLRLPLLLLPFPSAHGSLHLPGHCSHWSRPTPSPSSCWEPNAAFSVGTVGTWDDSSSPYSSLGSASVFLSVLILVLFQN